MKERRKPISLLVFFAVVNQTIAGLAAGERSKGKVALLGGPLYFMSELRRRFYETLGPIDGRSDFSRKSATIRSIRGSLSRKTSKEKTVVN